MRILLACSLVFNAVFAAGYVWSTQRGADRDAIAWATRELDLTPAQQTELAELHRVVRADVRAMIGELKPAIDDAVRLIRAAQPGGAGYEPPLRKIGEAGLALQFAVVERLLGFRERLAPAQRERFNARVADRGFMRRLAGLGAPPGGFQ